MITCVTFADSGLPLSLCVGCDYTGSYESRRAGRWKPCETRTRTKSENRKRGPALEHRAMTDCLWGCFYSAARSFLGFVLSALPSHPPTCPPLWMVLQMICVQFGFTRANRASKSRHTLPPSLQSARLSAVWELLNLFSAWVGLFTFRGKVPSGFKDGFKIHFTFSFPPL